MTAIDHSKGDKYYQYLTQGRLYEEDADLNIDIDMGDLSFPAGLQDGKVGDVAPDELQVNDPDEDFLKALEFALENHNLEEEEDPEEEHQLPSHSAEEAHAPPNDEDAEYPIVDVKKWGAFSISTKKTGAFGAIEGRCPFHRLSSRTDCKKLFTIQGPTGSDRLHAPCVSNIGAAGPCNTPGKDII